MMPNRIANTLNYFKDFFSGDEREEGPDQAALKIAGQIEDLKWVMSDKRGRGFVWGQLEVAGVYRSSYTGTDKTVFNEGQRNVGLILLDQLNQHCPNEYMEMLKEHSQ